MTKWNYEINMLDNEKVKAYLKKSGATADDAGCDISAKYDIAAAIAALYCAHPGSAHMLWSQIPDIQINDHDNLMESVNEILATNYDITVDDLMQFSDHNGPSMG